MYGFICMAVGAALFIPAALTYFAGLRPSEDVVRSQLEAVISGVAGVRDRAVVAPATNVSATVTVSAVLWLCLGQLQIGDM